MPIPILAVAALAKSGYDYFSARKKEKQAEEERANLKTPFYKIQDEYYQNRNIAAQNAEQGLPSSTRNYYNEELQRGLSSGISATEQGGGSPNDIAGLYDIYSKSLDRTAALDAQAKLGNIEKFMTANKELAGQKTIQYSLNEYQPYQRKLKEITERIGASQINQNNALNNAISTGASYVTAQSNSNLLSKLFTNTGTTDGAAPSQLTDNVDTPSTQVNYNDTIATRTSPNVNYENPEFSLDNQFIKR